MAPAESTAGTSGFNGRALSRFVPNLRHIRGDFAGALLAAVISVAQSIPFGLLVFAPLGAIAMTYGPLAGLYASIFASLVAAIFGGTPLMVSGPRASTSVVMAAIVAMAAASPGLEDHGGVPMALSLTFLALALAGVVELLFGVLRLGRTIKFVPYPVIAGFMNGVAILMLIGQARNLLGLPENFSWANWRQIPDTLHPWTAIVAFVTIAGIVIGPRISRLMPAPVTGMAFGIVAYYTFATFFGLDVLGPIIGELPSPTFAPTALVPALSILNDPWLWDRLVDLAPTIFVLAAVASIDSLMGSAALDSLTNSRHDSDRELIGQGMSNLASAVMGGIASTGAVSRSSPGYRMGARTRMTGVLHAVLIFAVTLVGGAWIGMIPRVVLAGMLVMVSLTMIDAWSRELLSRLRAAESHRREIVANLCVILIVAAVTVAFDLITAVATGVLVSMFLFVTKMSKGIIARQYDATTRRSLKVRDRADGELISAYGKEVKIVELDGPLFFGTADSLTTTCEKLGRDARVLILDFRRVSEIDATGIRLLTSLARTVAGHGTAILLAHVTQTDKFGRFISAIGGSGLFKLAGCFTDLDAALEWAEDRLVEAYAEAHSEGHELALSELPLVDGLAPEDTAAMATYLTRKEFRQGETLFRRGDTGSTLYLLARGTVTIRLARPGGGAIRLATLIPGVMFGEMALLEGQIRSADAVATTDIVVYEMDGIAFNRVLVEHPKLAARLTANMAREIAARLRVTSEQLRSFS